MNKFVKFILAAAAVMSFGAASAADIKASTPKSGYVQDGRGVIAMDPFGLCWRTGYWTPADAVAGCDAPLAPVCKAPQVLENGKCVTPPPVCNSNQDLVNGVCVDRAAPIVTPPVVCNPPQVLQNGKCVTPPPVSKKVTFQADALFDFNKSVLKKEGKAKLDDLTSKLGKVDIEVINANGHTDSVGSDAYNDKLSLRRAEAVKAYLKSKNVDPSRIFTKGFGEKQPVADNKTADGRAKNRRVEIELVGIDKN